MLSKLSLAIMALALFLSTASAFPFGWRPHPSGFPGFNGTFPTAFPTATGVAPTGFIPTGGFAAPTGYAVSHEVRRFEGARHVAHEDFYYPIDGSYGSDNVPTPTASGVPFPTGTGAFPTAPVPTGY